jgi:hypothetical protein
VCDCDSRKAIVVTGPLWVTAQIRSNGQEGSSWPSPRQHLNEVTVVPMSWA